MISMLTEEDTPSIRPSQTRPSIPWDTRYLTPLAVSEISNILFTQAGVDFGGLMFGPVGAVAGVVVGAGTGAFLGDMVGNVFTGKWF